MNPKTGSSAISTGQLPLNFSFFILLPPFILLPFTLTFPLLLLLLLLFYFSFSSPLFLPLRFFFIFHRLYFISVLLYIYIYVYFLWRRPLVRGFSLSLASIVIRLAYRKSNNNMSPLFVPALARSEKNNFPSNYLTYLLIVIRFPTTTTGSLIKKSANLKRDTLAPIWLCSVSMRVQASSRKNTWNKTRFLVFVSSSPTSPTILAYFNGTSLNIPRYMFDRIHTHTHGDLAFLLPYKQTRSLQRG